MNATKVHNVFLPLLPCNYCDYQGNDYEVKEKGPHTEAVCPKCHMHIKFLSKEDKYGTKEQQNRIWEKTKGRCCYCGKTLNPFKKTGYTIEHINPQINGGGHDTENLMPCCKSCNSQKGGKTIDEYREYLRWNNGKYIFYFEVMEHSTIGDILKKFL